MNIDKVKNKKYEVPLNVNKKSVSKYVKAIEKGWCKYFDVINAAGGFIMLGQLSELINLLSDKSYTKKSLNVITSRMVKEMESDKFIEVERLNKNKFIALRRPAIALSVGDYKKVGYYANKSKKSRYSDYNFKMTITKIDYFLKYGDIISNLNLINQLTIITDYFKRTVKAQKLDNHYDTDLLNNLCNIKNIYEGINMMKQTNERICKLGIIRDLWNIIGKIYDSLLKQNQTVILKPYWFSLNMNEKKDFTIDLIPEIFIYDIKNDIDYYKNKIIWLNRNISKYSNISYKELINLYNKINNNEEITYSSYNRIGFKLIIVGTNKKRLKKKTEILRNYIKDEIKKGNAMYVCSIEEIHLNTDSYFNTSSTNIRNKLKEKHEQRISQLASNMTQEIRNREDEFNRNIQIFLVEFKKRYKTCINDNDIKVKVPSMETLELGEKILEKYLEKIKGNMNVDYLTDLKLYEYLSKM